MNIDNSIVEVEYGLCKGEQCNRNGCAGVINEHEKEGSCSCHINPPCSYCTTDTAYCPECGWEACDEPKQKIDPEIEKRNQEYYKRQNEQWATQSKLFYDRYAGKEPIEKLEMRTESHTHFSQKVIGVFPKGTETYASLLPKVVGSFGGRFTTTIDKDSFRFEYIAYTD